MNSDNLSGTQRITLEALGQLANDEGRAKVSQRKLSEITGRAAMTINGALAKLEAGGWISVEKGRGGASTSSYTLTGKALESIQKEDTRQTDLLGSKTVQAELPDCLRARDLIVAGHMWLATPKDVPLTLNQAMPYAKTASKAGVRAALHRLEALAVPAATSQPDPSDRRRKLWTFHPLSDDEQAMIAADLSERVDGWRPLARAEAEAKHARERLDLSRKRNTFGQPELAELLIADTVPDAWECWAYQGRITAEGYVIIPGSHVTRGHRIVYAAFVQPIPPHAHVHHVCNFPLCLNPGHLVALDPTQHRWYTKHHGRRSGQALQYVTECKEHGTRMAHGNPAAPPGLFPCAEHEAELVALVRPGPDWHHVAQESLEPLHLAA